MAKHYSMPVTMSNKGVVYLRSNTQENIDIVAELIRVGVETTVLMKRLEDAKETANTEHSEEA